MNKANVIFMGNFLYPEGMAETKRIQHFVDGVLTVEGNIASLLLLRQAHPGRDDSRLSGTHREVEFRTIGQDLGAGLSLPWRLIRYLAQGASCLRKSRRSGYRNVLFVYMEPNLESTFFVVLAHMLGYRVIVDVTEDFYLLTENPSLASRLKARSVRFTTEHMAFFADAVSAISSFLKAKYERISNGRFPVYLIPISVDTHRILRSNRSFHRPVRIWYGGTFNEKDGVENLIAAFERVTRKFPDIELLLSGQGMKERMAEIDRLVAATSCKERIHYLGFLSDEEYFERLNECDIPCVVRVDSEFADRGFPFKLGEYLATGRPVITSRIGDVPSYLTDKQSAVLVKPGSVDSIVEALEFVLENEEQALKIGWAGRDIAERQFDADNNGKLVLRIIEQLYAESEK